MAKNGSGEFEKFTQDFQKNFYKKLLESHLEETKVESDNDLEIKQKKQRLEQDSQIHKDRLEERAKDRILKEKVANNIFKLLVIETAIIFIILFLQGFKLFGFNINDTTLDIFLPATIIQISTMAAIITKSLFPATRRD